MRPSDLIIVKLDNAVRVSVFLIGWLEIDLNHINFGLNQKTKEFSKKARSNFNKEDIVKIFELLNDLIVGPIEKTGEYFYFSTEVEPNWLKGKYKLIFCVNENINHTAGVITLYKLKEKKRS